MAKKKTAEKAKIEAAPVLRGPGVDPTPETPVITKSYSVRDDWKDSNKVNYVAFKSVDGEVQDLTVNGEPAGGGGGDLKIANVTVINNMANGAVQMINTYFVDENGIGGNTSWVYDGTSGIWSIIVYKDMATGGQLSEPYGTYTVTGDIEDDGDGYVYIKGDGTITIS